MLTSSQFFKAFNINFDDGNATEESNCHTYVLAFVAAHSIAMGNRQPDLLLLHSNFINSLEFV